MTEALRGPSQLEIARPNYGGLASEGEALSLLVARLAEALDPQMIWLFGSRARGDARPDSDFDLLVVAKEKGAFDSDDYDKVYAPASQTGVGADVVPCDLDVYRASLGLSTSFVYRVVEEGRLVYGSEPS
ncbi:MAG: nucleotidyltransferase domain-containing protein [Methylobacterium mesophilicum]|nr:nucleotidyltransferase domain-containing protein [Methylobacterium mesophilicum]